MRPSTYLTGLNEHFEQIIAEVDLDLAFDSHGNALDKALTHLDRSSSNNHANCLNECEKDGTEDGEEMSYYRMSDEHVAVRYPTESPPLASLNRPKSPYRVGQAKLRGSDTDRDKARHRQSNQGIVYYMDDRDSAASPQRRQQSSTPPPPAGTQRTRITSHQLFEYTKAIRAIRSIQSGLDSHRPWLFDPAAADTKIVRLPYLVLPYINAFAFYFVFILHFIGLPLVRLDWIGLNWIPRQKLTISMSYRIALSMISPTKPESCTL